MGWTMLSYRPHPGFQILDIGRGTGTAGGLTPGAAGHSVTGFDEQNMHKESYFATLTRVACANMLADGDFKVNPNE